MKKQSNFKNGIYSVLASILFCVNLNAQWNQIGNSIYGDSPYDLFGSSIDVTKDGQTIIVGAYKSDLGGYDSGSAKVLKLVGGTWVQVGASLIGELPGNLFGYDVSISDDGLTIAIGEQGSNSGGTNSGSVKVYSWNGTSWTLKGLPINGAAYEYASSVSLNSSGNVLAIGAPGNSTFASNSGSVQVYTWDGSAWSLKGAIILGEVVNNSFGADLSLSDDGNTLAIGGGNFSNGTDTYIGKVRVFNWDGSSWNMMGTSVTGDASKQYFGRSVKLSGDGLTFIAGAYGDITNGVDKGYSRVYRWNGSAWAKIGNDIIGAHAASGEGYNVGINEDGTVICSSAMKYQITGSNYGRYRVFSFDSSTNDWALKGMEILSESMNDIGTAMVMDSSGNKVIVSSHNNSTNGANSGSVRVFESGIAKTPEFIKAPIKLYPNPTSNILNFSSDDEITQVKIYSANGSEMLTEENKQNVDVSFLENGVYFIHVTTSKGVVVKRFVKA